MKIQMADLRTEMIFSIVRNLQFKIKLGMTGIDRKDYRSVSMSEHDDSLRYQMMIKQQMAIITSH
jgi:hypothetical protein